MAAMTLVEACEPLFQYVCRLNRSARKGASPEMAQVRAEVRAALADCRGRAAQAGHGAVYESVEVILVYFVDFMVRSSRLAWAGSWQDLAHERNKLAGDEDFFDQLDEALRDPSEGATERLAVFHTCLGLGFTGWYAGQPDFLRKKMQEISSRLRGRMDADRSARICPEAYEHVNTADLVQPPGRGLAGVGIVLTGLALTVVAANAVMYLEKRGRMRDALGAIVARQAGPGAAGGAPR